MISPTTSPYSSATIARWNFSACISRISRATGLFSGMKRTGRARSNAGVSPRPSRSARIEVLGEDQPDDVVAVLAALQREAAVAVGDGDVERRGDGGVLGHGDHVRPRHHHLAGDGVAELDDALDELALLVLDHLVLGRRLDDAEQLLLADERALLEALARQHHVGQPDQAAADDAQRREPDQRAR